MPANVPTTEEFNTLSARVTKLEGSTPVPPSNTASPDGTIVTPGSGTINDGVGHMWSVSSGGQVQRDTTLDTTSSGVVRLGWYSGVMWQENSAHRCWSTPPVWPTTWQPAGGVAVANSPFPQANSTTRAYDFVDSVGVNCHLGWTGTAYCNGPLVLNMLQQLGVRHVRDMPPTGWKQESDDALNLLANNGIKFNFVYGATGTSSDLTASVPADIQQVKQFIVRHPGSVQSMEGPNELNGQEVILNGKSSTDPHVGADIQRFCAAQTRANMSTPIMNLSITNGRQGWSEYVDQLGDLSAHCDQANWHVYFWQGIQPRGNVTYMIDDAHRSAPGRPVVFTEAGWPTAIASELGVDANTAAKNTLNLLADTWQMGVVRTYIYQLQDPIANPSDGATEETFGLCRMDGVLKPAGEAVRNLLSILRDTASNAATFNVLGLNYTIDGMPSTGYSLQLQKANGSFYILVWNEAVNWDAAANRPINVPAVNITMKLPKSYGIRTFDPVRNTVPQIVGSGMNFPLNLSDRMIVIEVT